MVTESRLAEKIGAAAGRLHTARSRNDQVATDFKLWTRAAIDEVLSGLGTLQDALIARAEEHADSVMPGFTHLQSAQPVTLGRSEEHTSELQSLMRISYAVFCLKKKNITNAEPYSRHQKNKRPRIVNNS